MPVSQLTVRQLEHATKRALSNCVVTVTPEGNDKVILSAESIAGRTVTEIYPEPLDQKGIVQLVRKFVGKVARTHAAESLPFAYIVRRNKDALWLRVVGTDDVARQMAISHSYARDHLPQEWHRILTATEQKVRQATFKYVRS